MSQVYLTNAVKFENSPIKKPVSRTIRNSGKEWPEKIEYLTPNESQNYGPIHAKSRVRPSGQTLG